MITGVYKIILRKGLFIKTGTISIRLVDNQLNGIITIAHKENEFTGTYNGTTLFIEGILQLPIGETYYSAKGKVVDNQITMDFTTDKGPMILTGKRNG